MLPERCVPWDSSSIEGAEDRSYEARACVQLQSTLMPNIQAILTLLLCWFSALCVSSQVNITLESQQEIPTTLRSHYFTLLSNLNDAIQVRADPHCFSSLGNRLDDYLQMVNYVSLLLDPFGHFHLNRAGWIHA